MQSDEHQHDSTSSKNNTKRIVVTGGSSGIGLAIVNRLLSEGYQVFNLDINPPENAESNNGQSASYLACDVTVHKDVVSAITHIANNGDISALVCNAGAHLSASIEDTSEDTLMSLFNLNVKGAFSATQAALPFMKEQGGSIVYISSDQAVIAKPKSFAYNLTKHALASMAKTTAIDYATYNIRANAVCPGTVDTPLYQKAIAAYCAKSGAVEAEVHAEEASMQPLGRIGKSSEVAAMVSFLVSDEASFITGSLQMIDGGYCAQ